MSQNKWFLLQLFAGEGDGAGSAGAASDGNGSSAGTTVEQGSDDGTRRLRELGVPEDKLKRWAKRNSAKLPEGAVRKAPEQPQETQQQVATATENPTEEKDGKTETAAVQRMSWEQIMADPEYNAKMQDTIRARLRSADAAQKNMEALTPALELLVRKYGLDPEKPDYEKLAEAVSSDKVYYEEQAAEMGVSMDVAMRVDQKQRDTAREEKKAQQQRYQAHFAQLEQQAQAVKQVFPDFDLHTELKNPAFARMTAPGTGIMSVEDAYRAVHRKEIEAAQSEVIAKQTTQKISNAIRSGARRPDENGTSGQGASVTTFNYANASREQREALKRQIRAAAARGEKLYPGR